MHRFRLIKRFAAKYMLLFIIAEICILVTYTIALLLPLNTQRLVDEVLIGTDYFLIYTIIKRYIIFFVVTMVFNLIYAYTWQTLNNRYVVDVKTAAFEKILKAKAEYLSNISYGDIMSRIDNDADQFIHVIQRNVFHFINSILLCIAIIVVLIKINLLIAILVVIAALLPIIATSLVTKLTEKYSRDAREIFGCYIGRLFEMLNGLRDIKLLGAIEWSKNSIATPLLKLIRLGNNIRYVDLYVNKSVYFLNLITSLLIYGISIKLVSLGYISIGLFFAAIEYISLLHKKFNWMLRIYLDWYNRKASIDRVSEVLNTESEKEEGVDIEKIDTLSFNNVTFSYESEAVLRSLSFNIEQGNHIAIVGVSGVGKTTIASLIMKFYAPQIGSIKINGIDITQISNKSLRQNIGWVGQDARVFNSTLRYNLTLNNDNICSDHLNGLIKETWLSFLPKDLDTILGKGGVNLSGGQKQLLSIARVLLKKPSLIVFDEISANLDENTEKEILEYIKDKCKDVTVIYISHRPLTVKQCDRIIVLKNGTIDGIGTHEMLLKSSTEYKMLFGRKGA